MRQANDPVQTPVLRIGKVATIRFRTPILLAIFVLATSGYVSEVSAQVGRGRPVIVRPRRDLAAGDIFAGLPKTVSRLDAANSGLYRIQGRPGAEISLQFTLPSELTSASGATLTIEFATGDAGYGDDQNQAAAVGFDPHAPFTARLGTDGRAYVWLGCTVRPVAGQPPGYYEAGVVLTANYTGN